MVRQGQKVQGNGEPKTRGNGKRRSLSEAGILNPTDAVRLCHRWQTPYKAGIVLRTSLVSGRRGFHLLRCGGRSHFRDDSSKDRWNRLKRGACNRGARSHAQGSKPWRQDRLRQPDDEQQPMQAKFCGRNGSYVNLACFAVLDQFGIKYLQDHRTMVQMSSPQFITPHSKVARCQEVNR